MAKGDSGEVTPIEEEPPSLGALFLEAVRDRLPPEVELDEPLEGEILRVAPSSDAGLGALTVAEAADELTIALGDAHTHVSLLDYMHLSTDAASKMRQAAEDAAGLVADIVEGTVVFFSDVDRSNVGGMAARCDLESDVLAGRVRLIEWRARMST